MKIEQLYTGCLSEAAYYIESKGEVAIIDPLREVTPYLEKALENNAKIKYVFETHFHADFVSGHVDLAQKSGAQIVFGPTAQTGYDVIVAEHGQTFEVGDLTITALHTPGHTLESTTYLLKDGEGKNHCLFTGDTLFIGDVGRPDLAIKADVTMEDLAGMLYDSLREQIMPLEDELIVYPAHGAGSACGKNISKETFSTLGEQKKSNYALQADLSREDFIKEITTGIMPAPVYFPKAAGLNKNGYESIDTVLENGTKALSPDQALEAQQNGALILDTRSKNDFHKGFIKGAVFIGIDGSFAPWVGNVIEDNTQPIVVLADEGREEEVALRLSRVGYDNCAGYIKGGFEAWKAADLPTDFIPSIPATELESLLEKNNIRLIDSRKPSEYEAEHACSAENKPLDFILDEVSEYDKGERYYVHCRSGYRSLIYTSIMKKNGIEDVVDIEGGFVAMQKTGVKMTDFTCSSKS